MEQPKKQPTPEEFKKAYEALCKEYGCEIVAEPALIPTNHGTFELTLRYQVVKTA
jgi:hypothetical protein